MTVASPVPVIMIDAVTAIGGAEITLLSLLRHLDRERYRPIAIVPGEGPLSEQLKSLQVEVHFVPMNPLWKTKSPVRSMLYMQDILLTSLRIAKLTRALGAVLIHTHTLRAHLYGGIAGRMVNIPVLIEHHDLPGTRFARYFWHMIFRLTATRLVMNSQAVEKLYSWDAKLRSRILLVYPPTDIRPVEPEATIATKAELSLLAAYPVVGVIAQIVPRKGILEFVEAAAHVNQHYPNAYFPIIGDYSLSDTADYWPKVQKVVRDLGIENHVRFLGFRQDVPELISIMDILVLPSRQEVFGKSLVEAMATGKPVVATRSGGPCEIVLDGITGLLVPPQDVETLAQAILELADNPKLAREMGERGRMRAQKLFGLDRYVNAITDLYSEIVGFETFESRR